MKINPYVVLACLSLTTIAKSQTVTPPFVQNGTSVTTPNTGVFTGATFSDGNPSHGYTVLISPSSGTLSLSNSSYIVEVGQGSSIQTTGNVSLTATGSDALYIDGNGTMLANSIQNAAGITASGDDLHIDGFSSNNNTIGNTGALTSTGASTIYLNVAGSTHGSTITNSGVLQASAYGIYLFGDDVPTNTITNTGAITGSSTGIYLSGNGSTTNTLTNSGAITATTTGISLTGDAASNTINNAGNIASQGTGILLTGSGSGSNHLTNSGTVQATGGNGIYLTVSGETGGNFISNSGAVTGSAYGIYVIGSGSGPTTLSNTATVIGQADEGIDLQGDGDTSNTVTNSGNVQGATTGLDFSGDSATGANQLTNSGAISSTSSVALNFSGDGAHSNSFANSGNVTSASGDGIDFSGESTTSNIFTNSGAVQGASVGISFNVNGTPTNTFNNSGSVTVSAGDGIDLVAQGATTNTFTNSGKIQASGIGISVTGDGTTTGTFNNSGQITATGDGIQYSENSGTTNSFTNSGSVSSGGNGINVTVNGTTTAQLNNSGQVVGHNGAGITISGDGVANSVVSNSGSVGGTTNGIFVSNTSGGSTSVANFGTVQGGSFGVDMFTTDSSGTVTFLNTGTVTGGSQAVVFDSNGSVPVNVFTNTGTLNGGVEAIVNGTGTNTFTNSGTINAPSSYPLAVTATGATTVTIKNTGTMESSIDEAIVVSGATTGTTSVLLEGGVETGVPHSIEFASASAPIVTVQGRSKLNSDIYNDNNGTLGTFNLNLTGVTPQVAAQVAALNGATSGSIATYAGYTYTWENLTLNATAMSFEGNVDPGLEAAARAIDLHGLQGTAYDFFYTSIAPGNIESSLNQLLGREVDQAIDTNEVNLGTQTAYEVNNHLDNIGTYHGDFDASGLQVSSSSLLAFAGTDSQLDSLLQMNRLGGTEMSTDTKDGSHMAVADSPRWSAWAAGTVTLADSSTTNTSPGYQATTGSPILGVDYRLRSDLTVGALVNYSITGANFADGSYLGAQTGLFGLYGAWHPGNWHLNTFVAGGYTSYDIDRNTFGGTANAHPAGSQAIADATGGYDIKLGQHMTFTPELGLTYTYVGVNGYTEGNAGAFDLTKGEQDIDSLRSHLGGRLSAEIPAFGHSVTFIPELNAAYYHEFMDGSRGVSTSLPGATGLGSFPVATANPERDFALVGAGLSTAFEGAGHPMAAFLDYDVQAGQSNYIAHNISAGLRVSF